MKDDGVGFVGQIPVVGRRAAIFPAAGIEKDVPADRSPIVRPTAEVRRPKQDDFHRFLLLTGVFVVVIFVAVFAVNFVSFAISREQIRFVE